MAEEDVPGATGDAAAGDGQDAVWRDLVARFDAPAPADGEAPWPELEDLDGPVHVTPAPPPMPPPVMPPAVPEALPREPPTNPPGLTGGAGVPGASSAQLDHFEARSYTPAPCRVRPRAGLCHSGSKDTFESGDSGPARGASAPLSSPPLISEVA